MTRVLAILNPRSGRSEPGAVEEALRLESPVQRTGRVAVQDFTLHDTLIRKGQRVWLMIGSASRDEAQFPHADTLDLERSDNRHLAFGYGTHFCVGAALARLEAQLAISSRALVSSSKRRALTNGFMIILW